MERNLAGITGLAHIGWTTDDRDGAMALLCDAFGIAHGRKQYSDQPYLAEVTGFADCAINIGFVQIEGDTLPLELLEYVRPQGAHMRTALGNPGAAHICFETDDIVLFERKLAANGIKLLAEPRVMGFGPWRGRKGAFFVMPDGLIVELIENRRENAQGKLTRLHHVGYSVSDAANTREIFCGSLGMEAAGRSEETGGYFNADGGITAVEHIAMPGSGFCIELLQCAGEAQEIATNMPGNVHLCWMTDDILAAYKELESRGLRFVKTPGKVTAGANAGAMAGYLCDPYEVRCELFQGAPTRVTG